MQGLADFMLGDSKLRGLTFKSFILITIVSALVMEIVVEGTIAIKKERDNQVLVVLKSGDKSLPLTGLIDTGNSLRDMYTGKPVSVTDYKTIISLLSKDMKDILDKYFENGILPYDEYKLCVGNIRTIAYESIDKKAAKLPVICIDEITLHIGSKDLKLQEPLVAISKESISSNKTYNIILHKELLN